MHTSVSVLLHSVNQPLFPREKFLQEPCPCEYFSSQTNSCCMVVINKMGVDMTWSQKLKPDYHLKIAELSLCEY